MKNKAPDGEFNDEREPYDIELTDEALYAYADICSPSVLKRIDELVDILPLHPYFGEEYDPAYESARPPMPCRFLFCAQYGVYYHVDEARRLVAVLAIESQRRNPLMRFTWNDI